MKRRMFALLLALMLAASCCWTGFSEETEAQGQALETEENGENVAVYELNSADTGSCFHTSTRSENIVNCIDPDSYKYEDYTSHSYYEYTISDIYCADCGKLLKEGAASIGITNWGSHVYENGACKYCGAEENACPHENTSTYKQPAAQYRYEPCDADGHYEIKTDVYVTHCKDCQRDISTSLGKSVKLWKEHQWDESYKKCQECGYENACQHANTERKIVDKYLRGDLTAVDEKAHSGKITYQYGIVCKDCGLTIEDGGEEETEEIGTEPHSFEDGRCGYCDYEINCAHEHQQEHPYSDEVYLLEDDLSTHTHWYENWMAMICEDCGEQLSDTRIEENSIQEAHTFVDGKCEKCGYVSNCNHEETYEEGASKTETVNVNEKQHTTKNTYYNQTRCAQCDEVLAEKILSTDIVAEDHVFVDSNICFVCGYETSCQHETKTTRVIWGYSRKDDGDEGHYIYRKQYEDTICKDCGREFTDIPMKVLGTATYFEPHSYDNGVCYVCQHVGKCDGEHLFEDGRCLRCGQENTCLHEHKTTRTKRECQYSCFDIEKNLENEHVVTWWTAEEEICDDCGETVSYNTLTESCEETEAHQMVDGKCAKCGFIRFCEHKNTEIQEEHEDEVLSKDEQNHTVKRTTYKETVCKDCDEMLDVESGEPTEVTEAHSFADGVCTVCGQAASQPTEAPSVQPTEAPSVQPTVAPDVTVAPTARAEAAATPAPTEEPVYEEVPAEEPVHGVKAEDKIPMVETLSTVAEALETEEAQVTIANVEKIVTPEEKAALDQLPLREQMLTVLCAIGFEEQVTEALAGEGVSLSEEAEALKEQILARIDAMNEEEKAAFQQMLEENFPVETVEMDGVEYRFFVFEVEIETEEGLRRERYGFREEAGAWIFVKLSVAETAK